MCRTVWLRVYVLIAAAVMFSVGGCTSPGDYIKNGFKVGPNPCVPAGDTASRWLDDSDVRVRQDCADLNRWWTVFQDPTLDRLISNAASQNLTLREAGFRILEARAQLWIAQGNMFPQSQTAFGSYQRGASSEAANTAPGIANQFFDQWNFGFGLAWELDFWGRFRRAVDAADSSLNASCANYDDVLVTLLGDVASNYVQVRTLQQRIELTRGNVDLQERVVTIANKRFKAGRKNELDAHQARSNSAQTEAQIPQLRIAMRQACNRLCVLLGMPPSDLERELGPGPIPTAPAVVAVGIPAELLRRRPDVRRAQHLAEAQGQHIGMAEAELYPMFFIAGTLGWQAENLPQMFTSSGLNSSVGPAFQWNILNYGRIRNNMRAQDAKFWQLVANYQNTVLRANAEVEDGLVAFLRAQERAKLLDNSVVSNRRAVDMVMKEYQGGATDFNRLTLIQQNLVQQQDMQAQAHGEIAQGLIQVYRALGGGWQYGAVSAEPLPIAPLPTVPIPDDYLPSAPSDKPMPPKPAPAPGAVKAPYQSAPRTAPLDLVKAPLPPAARQQTPAIAKAPLPPAARTPAAEAATAPLPPAPQTPSIDAAIAPFPPSPATAGSTSVFTAGLSRSER
jgi:NodT family efflux transporter outer membrane factor (OMF) lipoprotein